ncbi:alpha/beta fold hydrolase [Elioraea tepidiphila]|uniref:alpha/beta fold hydrolase n=1 Tax=Elioraea tepidiphila TaxID=457934 RepID=UPI00036F4B0F|nr:alpha/beta fold hydrolase [Elioraea tepidiphila]
MQTPHTRYALSGGVRIAYQVTGQGPIDLVFVPGFISNLELHWEEPGYSHLLRRLSAFARVIHFDKRGTGLSDRVDVQHLPDLETRMDDVRAVMDAVGSGRAALLGASEGAPMSILFAATYPERTRALVLYGGYAQFHSAVLSAEQFADFVRKAEQSWGTGASLASFAPGLVHDPRFSAWWARFERLSVSPTAAIALARMNATIDVRGVLGAIRVPTLVIHRREDARVKFAAGRFLAERIPGARFVELPGRDHPIWTGDIDRVVDAIEEFLTGTHSAAASDRVLATLLVARLAHPERAAARLGDRLWAERIAHLHGRADEITARHGGRVIGSGSETIAARFDGSARAVHAAVALRHESAALGIALAIGVHAGEVDLRSTQAAGLALHVAERIAALAGAGEILVSGVVRDLVAGSGLHFKERGATTIGGMDGPVPLLAVVAEQHLEPRARSPAEPDLAALSGREREVLGLIADGLGNAAIAARLALSEHTVKRHVANILLKLDLPTRAAAAAFAARRRV